MNTKNQLIAELKYQHDELVGQLRMLTVAELNIPRIENYTTGQYLAHISCFYRYSSKLLRNPKWLLHLKQTISVSRMSTTESPNFNKWASKICIPVTRAFYSDGVITELDNSFLHFVSAIENWTENDLETYQLHHPVLGKMDAHCCPQSSKYKCQTSRNDKQHNLNLLLKLRDCQKLLLGSYT